MSNLIKICDVREKLMECWKRDAQSFRNLRNECGTYVFDAVMAVLLGGTGISKPDQKGYIVTVFHKTDVSPWKANAGLKSNQVNGSNYSQRGFFNFPIVDNKRIQMEFLPQMPIDAVCERIKSYSEECFRKNKRNEDSDPANDFIETLLKILCFLGLEKMRIQKLKFPRKQPQLRLK